MTTSEKPTYRTLADDFRQKISSGVFAPGMRLPTEVELRDQYKVSRHTIRQALKEIVAEGLLDQIQGSGTYVRGHPKADSSYIKTIGSLEDLVQWPGTETEVLTPFATHLDASTAARLQLRYIEVSTAVVRRSFKGEPFAITHHHVDPALGQTLREHGIPSGGAGTVIGAAAPFLPYPVVGVQQSITALNANESIATPIGAEAGDAVLLIERLYYDTTGSFVEFTESFFNPRRYTYRVDLRGKGRGS